MKKRVLGLTLLEAAWERLQPGLLLDLEELAAEKQKLGLGDPVLDAWDLPLILHRFHNIRILL